MSVQESLTRVGLGFLEDVLLTTEKALLQQVILAPPDAEYPSLSSSRSATALSPIGPVQHWSGLAALVAGVIEQADLRVPFSVNKLTEWTSSCPALYSKKMVEVAMWVAVYCPLAKAIQVTSPQFPNAIVIGERACAACDAFVDEHHPQNSPCLVETRHPGTLQLPNVANPLHVWNNSSETQPQAAGQQQADGPPPRVQLQSAITQLYGHMVCGHALFGVINTYEVHLFLSRIPDSLCSILLEFPENGGEQWAAWLHHAIAEALLSQKDLFISDVVRYPGDILGPRVMSSEFFGTPVALKTWDLCKFPDTADEMLNEVRIYRHLMEQQCPHIVTVVAAGFQCAPAYPVLATALVKTTAMQLEHHQAALSALQDIHDRAVLHGDVHCGNIIIAQDTLKVYWVDFARSCIRAGVTRHHPDALQEQACLRERLGMA
ncbi:hypothetical protein WJX73_004756 [Symbiochloris irregularis]|uniref:Protein kinase domain-containing protein n=1 Tax=Symbiochloris irregularis TaxID=706552 RepID=A0AAW1PQ60_9CHLO